MNHSFTPSVRLEAKMLSKHSAELSAFAITAIAEDEPILFDYTLFEWELAEPFVDHASGRLVRGFSWLTVCAHSLYPCFPCQRSLTPVP